MLDSLGNNGAARPCPHLGLISDPSTSCRFPIDSHRCFRWPLPERAEPGWQSTYCISGRFALCPRYAMESGSPPAYQGSAEDGVMGGLAHLARQLRLPLPLDRELSRPAVLASIAAVAIGLLLLFQVVLPRVLGGADQAGGLPTALPTMEATAAPAVVPTIAPPADPAPSVTASPTAQSTPTLAPTPRQAAPAAAPTARQAAPSATPSPRPPTSTATAAQATSTATPPRSAQGTAAATPPAVGATPGATAPATPQATASATAQPTTSATPQATPGSGATPTPAPLRQTTMENGQRIYVVASGDNLWQIARSFGVSAEAITQANELASQTSLQVGQRLVIP